MRNALFCIALALVLLSVPAAPAQETQIGVEAGFQVVDSNGNEDVYRTQVNDLLLSALALGRSVRQPGAGRDHRPVGTSSAAPSAGRPTFGEGAGA